MKKLNNKGFSLVELMVVVAIIGILSAIAVPNFQRFQRKARQSEAKSNLSALYTHEKAFLAEWNGYTSDFGMMGLQPEGRLIYQFGFAGNVSGVAQFPGYTGFSNTFANTGTYCPGTAGTPCTLPVQGYAQAAAPVPAVAGCAVGANPSIGPVAAPTFNASAIGMIGGAVADQWAVNQINSLCNNISGIN